MTNHMPDLLCLTFVSQACFAGWNHSIFDAVAGGLDFEGARKHENRNTSHAKTSIYPLQVLKTSSLEGSREPPTLPVPGFWFPRGALKSPKTRKKSVF